MQHFNASGGSIATREYGSEPHRVARTHRSAEADELRDRLLCLADAMRALGLCGATTSAPPAPPEPAVRACTVTQTQSNQTHPPTHPHVHAHKTEHPPTRPCTNIRPPMTHPPTHMYTTTQRASDTNDSTAMGRGYFPLWVPLQVPPANAGVPGFWLVLTSSKATVHPLTHGAFKNVEQSGTAVRTRVRVRVRGLHTCGL